MVRTMGMEDRQDTETTVSAEVPSAGSVTDIKFRLGFVIQKSL